jgi:hypothetical protein
LLSFTRRIFALILLSAFFGNANETIVFSFELQNNGGKITVFESESKLGYTLVDKDGKVEFECPARDKANGGECADRDNFKFSLDDKKEFLNFKNKKSTYLIYDNGEDYGIRVMTGIIMQYWKGANKNGSLKNINALENVKLVK